MFTNKAIVSGAMALCALLAATTYSRAEVDFGGKRITMIIPYQEGSGSTFHGRLFAEALERELPGNPTIIVKNIEGGGSIRGINEFHRVAEPNGLTVAAIGTGTSLSYVLGDPAVHYDLAPMTAFVSSPYGVIVYARTDLGLGDDPVENVRTLLEKPSAYGGKTPTSSDLPALLSIDLMGIKPNYIFGLSSSDTRAALERGEVSLNYDNAANWSTNVKPLMDEGLIKPLFTLGFAKDGEIQRDPLWPEIPTFFEVYEEIHGKSLEGPALEVWLSLFNIRVSGGKILLLPEGTPQEIVDIYNEAAAAALSDPIMQTPQAEVILADYPQSIGTDANTALHSGIGITDSNRQWLKDWLLRVHDVK
ncbi:hypothetical protein [Paracoccus saliphilus]|uniref:Tripartite-type tricarboxylate transporter, receptor component TctC n=1 Tax=Paracoccus saliphilus TaxID=405559 RepID=A0AA46A7G9_9RHOB|nr:hypothetical protein [Paracoccus saliphilus]WCR01547.1 hypothetical protein JHX88_11385 [Paracoccus saliphilus]SIT12542.1 Tripartite-type tricarboxylate transporter, receptor component TctC [Paracoccus saliphilus]